MSLRRVAAAIVCALAFDAGAQTRPPLDVVASPSWQGWTRGGRSTELGLRLATAAEGRLDIQVRAGQQTLRSVLAARPGEVHRLHWVVPAAERLELEVRAEGGAVWQQVWTPSLSEKPLLAWAVAPDDPAAPEGFHVLRLAAPDLPRSAPAYTSVDALVIDAATMAALEPAQLAALLAHAADCGRLVVMGVDGRAQRLLQGAAGCGGAALAMVPTAEAARRALALALDTPTDDALPAPAPDAAVAPPAWGRVAVLLTIVGAVALLGLWWAAAPWAGVAVSALAALAALGGLAAVPADTSVAVWSEGVSGATTARYRARQHSTLAGRGTAHLEVPELMAASARPCDPRQPLVLDLEPNKGLVRSAAFEARLFKVIDLCFAGSFPMSRAIAVSARPDGAVQARNPSATAWPAGWLVAGGRVRELPGLGAGAAATVAGAARAPASPVERHAVARLAAGDDMAALWPLDLSALPRAAGAAEGWLLVKARTP